jgi:hypothetical protein
LPSSQFLAGFEHAPPVQVPATWQASEAVHTTAAFEQPVVGLQESVVQRLPSSQFLAGFEHAPPVQVPATWQASEAVHTTAG